MLVSLLPLMGNPLAWCKVLTHLWAWFSLFKFFLSKIRAHVATCSKYQSYIMEGVKASTKDTSLQQR